MLRFGKVTNIYPESGRMKVLYEDERNTSLPLPLLTMNGEYIMPEIGERVATLHRENGSSKGIVLGTYYGSRKPVVSAGYRKDFGRNSYADCINGIYGLHAKEIAFECSYGRITAEDLMRRIERIENALGLPHTI